MATCCGCLEGGAKVAVAGVQIATHFMFMFGGLLGQGVLDDRGKADVACQGEGAPGPPA